MARRLVTAGANVLGFVGRSPHGTAAAIAFAGAGRVLAPADAAAAHVVVFAVGDGDLHGAIAATVAAAPARACSLWLHTSGRFGLDVFAAAGPGIRRGAIHPAAPLPDAAAGARALAGAPALVEGEPRAMRLLHRVCAMVGLVPIDTTGVDRVRYHAACALAANGLTALRAIVDRAFAAAGVTPAEAARVFADALMAAALRTSSELGPGRALSGPVRRGDAATVAAHVAALAAVPDAVAAYRSLMLHALRLSADLPPAAVAAVARALAVEEQARS